MEGLFSPLLFLGFLLLFMYIVIIRPQNKRNKEINAMLFTSGKTAINTAQIMNRRFGANWKTNLDRVKLISIGPQTSISCRKCFQRVDQEANPHDLDGLINASICSLQKE